LVGRRENLPSRAGLKILSGLEIEEKEPDTDNQDWQDQEAKEATQTATASSADLLLSIDYFLSWL